MSWTDEEIDKLAREGAGNKSFEYKDEYWKEMEAMLPSLSRKKDFLWFFTAFMFVGLIGTSFLYQPTNTINDTNIAQANSKEIYNQTEQSSNAAKANSISSINASEDVKMQEVSVNSPQQQNNAVTSSPNKQLNTVTSENNKVEKSAIETKRPTALQENKRSLPLETEQSVSTGSEARKPVEKSIGNLPLLGLSTNSAEQQLAASHLFNERELPMKATMYIGGFAGLSQSLITPSDQLSNSFGIGLGTQIQKGRLLLTAGVNGVWSNHKDLVLNRRAKVYGFGSNEYSYDFDYREIYSLEAELTVGYKFRKHTVNVGVRPSYVMGTKVGVSSSVNETMDERKTYYGNMDGINRFGIKPTLGYAFDLCPSLKVGVNIGVQLMPMIQEDYLIGKNNRLPIDGQLYIRKSLRFKK